MPLNDETTTTDSDPFIRERCGDPYFHTEHAWALEGQSLRVCPGSYTAGGTRVERPDAFDLAAEEPDILTEACHSAPPHHSHGWTRKGIWRWCPGPRGDHAAAVEGMCPHGLIDGRGCYECANPPGWESPITIIEVGMAPIDCRSCRKPLPRWAWLRRRRRAAAQNRIDVMIDALAETHVPMGDRLYRRRGDFGSTYVELLMVLLILGTIATIAITAIPGIEHAVHQLQQQTPPTTIPTTP